MKAYSVNIIGLSNKIHHFHYELGDAFIKEYGNTLFPTGQFKAEVTLGKNDTFMEAQFDIHGTARLTCDRSLDEFDFPVNISQHLIFKFGEEYKEVSDDVIVIPRDLATLDVGQYLYEFIGLSIPMKKLHPRFHGEGEQEGIVYTSEQGNENLIDPRWDALRKINN